jgi:regulatory protein
VQIQYFYVIKLKTNNNPILNSNPTISYKDALRKIEHFCAYQERCHQEVEAKLYGYKLSSHEIAEAIGHLLANNYLNEERFACLFAISKFHQKNWGRKRISLELKQRKISSYLINKGLKEIPDQEYCNAFEQTTLRFWELLNEKNSLKKRKKFCDYFLRKGWESDRVYEKAMALEKKG